MKLSHLFNASLLLLTMAAPALAQDSDMDKMKKELKILTKILNTSFDTGEDAHRRGRDSEDELGPRDIEALYLKGQGVVLSIQLGMGDQDIFHMDFGDMHHLNFQFDFADIPVIQALPVIDMDDVDVSEIEESRMEEIENLQEAMADLAEEAAEAMSESVEMLAEETPFDSPEDREKIRELRRQQREAIREVRIKARDARKKLRRPGELSEEERKNLMAQVDTYKKELKETIDTNFAKIRTVREEQKSRWKERLGKFEDQLFQVVCEYGASLRLLPDSERLTIVLKGADREESSRDRIMIFKKSDLLSCRNGDITLAELKNRADRYAF